MFHGLTLLQRPLELVPKLFGPLRERYLTRPGGYTRVLHIEPLKEDQAPSAILELVDGPKDMRFNMTASTLARQKLRDEEPNEYTARNVNKVTRYRQDGERELEEAVERYQALMEEETFEKTFGRLEENEIKGKGSIAKRKVYPESKEKKERKRSRRDRYN